MCILSFLLYLSCPIIGGCTSGVGVSGFHHPSCPHPFSHTLFHTPFSHTQTQEPRSKFVLISSAAVERNARIGNDAGAREKDIPIVKLNPGGKRVCVVWVCCMGVLYGCVVWVCCMGVCMWVCMGVCMWVCCMSIGVLLHDPHTAHHQAFSTTSMRVSVHCVPVGCPTPLCVPLG